MKKKIVYQVWNVAGPTDKIFSTEEKAKKYLARCNPFMMTYLKPIELDPA